MLNCTKRDVTTAQYDPSTERYIVWPVALSVVSFQISFELKDELSQRHPNEEAIGNVLVAIHGNSLSRLLS